MVAEGRISNDDRFKKVAEKVLNVFKERVALDGVFVPLK